LENSQELALSGSAAPLTAQVKALTHLLRGIAATDVRGAVWPALKQFVARYGYLRLAVFQQAPSQAFADAAMLYSDGDHRIEHAHGHSRALLEAFRANEPVATSQVNSGAEIPATVKA